jgi:hypothetical protein
MKFLRQLAAVLAVVAVVVLIGFAWDHFGPASLPGEGPAGGQFSVRGQVVKNLKLSPGVKLPAGARPPPGVRLTTRGGSTPVDLGDLLEPASLAVFRTTVVTEALIMTGVVILSIGARRWRRARRRAAASQPRLRP